MCASCVETLRCASQGDLQLIGQVDAKILHLGFVYEHTHVYIAKNEDQIQDVEMHR
jgi:hypothetical protein